MESVKVKKITRLEQAKLDVAEYFGDADVELTDRFDMKAFADHHELTVGKAVMAIVNLESEQVMNDIAKGDYTTFDLSDRDQFNDGWASLLGALSRR